MAAVLRSEFSHLLRLTATQQPVFVRWKKKPPEWRDPADLSWAAPLLEKMKQQQQQKSMEQPPAMLHMVSRVRSTYGRPHWEKKTLKSLGLDKVKKYEPVVHKNTPQVNKKLESVKHLVKIVPVTFPHGLPSDESDFHHCLLHADGQLEVKKTLHPLEKCVTEGEEDKKKLWEMDEETVEKVTRKVLNDFSLSREYFPAKYVYKYNQDGKEHRYTGNHNIGGDRDWY
ncbi:uncharacterized protein LOC143283969 [Babylonia areolata]|uniref:uncharacterized protein LOC143283969 n=1 Tax=Babylonia areolata TaxID=304850 RepID=UPI003FD5A4E3